MRSWPGLLVLFLLCGSPGAALAQHLGDFPMGATVSWKFPTSAASGARTDPSNAWEPADLRCYKGGSATKRASTNGYTVTYQFDGMTGVTHVDVNTADNSDPGFWSAGSEIQCGMYPDTETIDGVLATGAWRTFSLERTVRPPVIMGGTAVIKDATGVILTIPVVRTNGKPYTGLTFASFIAERCRPNVAGACVADTLTGTCTLGSYTSGCFLERDATAGLYEYHAPAAAFATGVDRGVLTLTGPAGSVPTIIPYDLVTSSLAAIATTLGTPAGASMSADIATIQTGVSAVGTPAGASLSADVAAVKTAVDASAAKIGTPAGASLSLDVAGVKTVVDSTKTKTDPLLIAPTGVVTAGATYRRNVAGQTRIPLFMRDAANTSLPKTGLTLTVTVSKDGTSFSTATGTRAEIANGWYTFAPSQSDLNCDLCIFNVTSTGAVATGYTIQTAP